MPWIRTWAGPWRPAHFLASLHTVKKFGRRDTSCVWVNAQRHHCNQEPHLHRAPHSTEIIACTAACVKTPPWRHMCGMHGGGNNQSTFQLEWGWSAWPHPCVDTMNEQKVSCREQWSQSFFYSADCFYKGKCRQLGCRMLLVNHSNFLLIIVLSINHKWGPVYTKSLSHPEIVSRRTTSLCKWGKLHDQYSLSETLASVDNIERDGICMTASYDQALAPFSVSGFPPWKEHSNKQCSYTHPALSGTTI